MPADLVTPAARSRMMAGIKGQHTKPEKLIRSLLHRRGFRFRLHQKGLPGKPDLVFPRYRAVALIHGCFWHGHDCHLFRWPKSRQDFWHAKIDRNRQRDREQYDQLISSGWRVAMIWECALKGRSRLSLDVVADRCSDWLVSDRKVLEVRGNDEARTVG